MGEPLYYFALRSVYHLPVLCIAAFGWFFRQASVFSSISSGKLIRLELAGHKGIIAGQVHQAVAAVAKQNDLFFAFFFGLFGFLNGRGDGMAGFGGTDKAFGLGPGHRGFIAFDLVDGPRRVQSFDDALADQRRHAVIAQAAGVNRRRHKSVAQRVHRQQRRHAGGIAVVIGERCRGSGSGRPSARRE